MEVAYVAAVAITVPVFPRRMPPTTYSAKEHETSHVWTVFLDCYNQFIILTSSDPDKESGTPDFDVKAWIISQEICNSSSVSGIKVSENLSDNEL